jgi:fatty acid kinase
LERWVSERFPDVEVEVHDGRQPLYPYLLGVE